MLNVFPIVLYLRALRQGLSLNPKLCIWARVIGQRVLRIYMSLPAIAGVAGMCNSDQLFTWVLESGPHAYRASILTYYAIFPAP